VQNGAIEVGPI